MKKPEALSRYTNTEINDLDWGNLSELEDAMKDKRKAISETKTPKSQVKRRPDGMDYVEEGYMRHMLDQLYPIWSWVATGNNPIQILGSEYVVATGELVIYDEGVTRRFHSTGAARIQYKRGAPHTIENMIDLDKNVASANTFAFKRAVNRLTHISDDVYRKVIELIDLKEEDIKKFHKVINWIKDEEKREEVLLWFAEKVENTVINQKNSKDWYHKMRKWARELNGELEETKNKKENKKGDK